MLQATEFEATWGVVGDRPISCVRLWSSYDVNIEDGIIVAGLAKLHPYGKVRERLWDLGDRKSGPHPTGRLRRASSASLSSAINSEIDLPCHSSGVSSRLF